MPNHWESSARPLFVRTVFVNGNRHAILFEEDPLLRYGNSPLKKISRSNSWLSFGSDTCLTSSESQDSNSEERVPRVGNSGHRQRKDLSSELQSCLINLQLASGNLGSRSDEEKWCCRASNEERSQQEEITKGRKHRGKREKSCRRKHCEGSREESKETKSGGKLSKDTSCYFYNFESIRRKKNYCVVRISSQPPQFTLSCQCDGEVGERPKCAGCSSGKNNMVISATIHNLLMASRKEKLSGHALKNGFLPGNPDSVDLCWSAYWSKSHYNSLSDRVFQWLDLASRRKSEKQKVELTREEDSSKSVERICSGKTFAGESKKTESSDDNKQRNKTKKTENIESETQNEKVEKEVKGEPNIATILSTESSEGDTSSFLKQTTATALSQTFAERKHPPKNSISTESNLNSSSEVSLRNSVQQANVLTLTKPPLKVQDLLLDYNWREKYSLSSAKRNKRKTKELRDLSTFQRKLREARRMDSTDEEEEESDWEEKASKTNQKHSGRGEKMPCRCNKSSDGYSDKIKNQLLTEGLSERNEKSINNLNFTRGRAVSVQNLLPSQQHDKISDSRTEKIVWRSEKSTGRPQLHIFMPSLPLTDASDDSMSECENVLNLC